MRSLSTDERLEELENELEKVKWDIMGLSETRRKGGELMELPSGNILYHKGTEENINGGVGFIINKKIKDEITQIGSIS